MFEGAYSNMSKELKDTVLQINDLADKTAKDLEEHMKSNDVYPEEIMESFKRMVEIQRLVVYTLRYIDLHSDQRHLLSKSLRTIQDCLETIEKMIK